MLAWKVAPALACSNTIVLKPAEQTPLSVLYFSNLLVEAGLPKGVVNIIPGLGRVSGAALACHLDVDKIAFIGITATGRAVIKAASANLENITLECGGKSPSIVFEDADLDQAAKWCHVGIMIYVHESVYEEFLDKFVAVKKANAQVGDPFGSDTYHGPQVSRPQYDKILSYIEQGKKSGVRLLHGGAEIGEKGCFLEPTVFADDMTVVKEEIFGPVVVISRFSIEAEVVAKANDSPHGLAAALFTEKVRRAHKVARKLQAGMVWINSSGDSHFGVPFGGYKSSGIGRELGPAIHVNLGTDL
ncbi:aldehyde dehydrogenase domain-containing protein [Ilyonectria destructans]|nr:aldehyde dehydrogenase domain-containing protein [Ilyonectria destructans]